MKGAAGGARGGGVARESHSRLLFAATVDPATFVQWDLISREWRQTSSDQRRPAYELAQRRLATGIGGERPWLEWDRPLCFNIADCLQRAANEADNTPDRTEPLFGGMDDARL